MSETSFSTLDLHPSILKNLGDLGYEEMTPIQAQSLPLMLAGKDVIAQGKTGSGKTAAFGLALLAKLKVKSYFVNSLVLCPTRELADQVAKALRQLARTTPNVKILTLCGGTPFGPQIGSLEHGAHIVVGTPGRVDEHVRKGTLKLNRLKQLVLDEADRMLDMGFQDEIDSIIDHCATSRQTLLFSATYQEKIQAVAESVMRDPEMVEVASTHDHSSIKQYFYKIGDKPEQRMKALQLLLQEHQPETTVIFCTTKRDVQDLADDLIEDGFSAIALHGGLEQRERDQALVQFASNSSCILVATDVAARGLDIEKLDAVINYHISRDFEVHVHRIGRTGRAGSKGLALSLYSEKESHKMQLLQEFLDQEIESEELPDVAVLKKRKMTPPMVTLCINVGKKDKLRPGNILGSLTGKGGIAGSDVGKIHIFDRSAYVAVRHSVLDKAMKKLASDRWKGLTLKGWLIQS